MAMFKRIEYELDKEHRAKMMRQAEPHHLAHEAADRSQYSASAPSVSMHISHRLAAILLLVIVFILAEMLLPHIAEAQDRVELGNQTSSTLPAAYRIGHYYFVIGEYDKAISEYLDAIAQIPPDVFEKSDDFAVMYWHLGNAQFMAGQPDDALKSYQTFLDLMNDGASEKAIEFVNEFEIRIADGTYATMTILQR